MEIPLLHDARAARLTAEDFRALPDDGKRYELLEGILEMTPGPSTSHQVRQLRLSVQFFDWVRDRHAGLVLTAPYDVVLSEGTVVQPDLLFVSKERLSIVEDNRCNGAPDLVVEIFTLAGALRDTEIKRTLYAQAGVREYWQVNLDRRSVVVLELTEAGYDEVSRATASGQLARSKLLAGFEISLDELFADL